MRHHLWESAVSSEAPRWCLPATGSFSSLLMVHLQAPYGSGQHTGVRGGERLHLEASGSFHPRKCCLPLCPCVRPFCCHNLPQTCHNTGSCQLGRPLPAVLFCALRYRDSLPLAPSVSIREGRIPMARLLPDGSGRQTRQIYVQKLKSVIADNSNNGVSNMT